MSTLPTRFEAHQQAAAAANKPLVLPEYLATQVLKAIEAGEMSVVLDVKSNVKHVEACFRLRGYDLKWVPTGYNESGLEVSWA